MEALRLEKLEVKPLDPERQREYLQRYLGEVEGDKLLWLMAGDDVSQLWQQWQGAGATWEQFRTAEEIPQAVYSRTTTAQDELWKRLRQGWLPSLWALGRNPLMLVMLAQVYDSKGTLPQNRAKVFAAFVDTLLERQCQRTDPELWPGSVAIQASLSRLAFTMQSAGERGTAVERAWAIQQLHDGVDPERLLYLAASAILLDTSGGKVRFIHQLIQEYFAAAALAERLAAGEDFARYWPKGWVNPTGWEEIGVLLAGIRAGHDASGEATAGRPTRHCRRAASPKAAGPGRTSLW